jgi:hypothetical protein
MISVMVNLNVRAGVIYMPMDLIFMDNAMDILLSIAF